MLSVLLILALVAAGVAVVQRGLAQERHRIVTAHDLVAQAERDTDSRTALQLGVAAERIRPDGQTRSSLVNALMNNRYVATLTDHSDEVISVAFSPEGNVLATASADRSVILWDLTDPARPRTVGQPLTGHSNAVVSVAFTPDSNMLATASTDNTAMLWDLTSLNHLRDQTVERACSITGRGIDHDQWARYIPGLPYQDTCPA